MSAASRVLHLAAAWALAASAVLQPAGCACEELPPACPTTDADFDRALNAPLFQRRCVLCHNAAGPAAASGLRFDASPHAIKTAVTALARVDKDGVALLLAKPTGQVPHGGGAVIASDGPEADLLRAFIALARGESATCDALSAARCATDAPARTLRRLSPSELDATLRDALGTTRNPGAAFPVDAVGLDVDGRALAVSLAWADQMRMAAESLAEEQSAALLALHAPCIAQASAHEPACAAALTIALGQRLFRRDLTPQEHTRYAALFAQVAADEAAAAQQTDGGAPPDAPPVVAARWVLTAMLQSPHFLYRAELGARRAGSNSFTLTGTEMATLLAYTLWGTAPDVELLDDARAGLLDTDAGVRRAAERLQASPRAHAHLRAVVSHMLGTDALDRVAKDALVYPGWSAGLRADMVTELDALLEDVRASGGSFGDALLWPTTFLTPALAAHYGLADRVPADATGAVAIDTTGTARGGLLTTAAVLAAHSKPAAAGPVQRGLFVREQLLCQDLPPPPPNVDASPPPRDLFVPVRAQYEAHAAQPACAACHHLLDPVGFAFDHFDGVGAFHERDGSFPIDDNGLLHAASIGGAFRGVHGLAHLLAETPDVSLCLSTRATAAVYGAPPLALGCRALDDATGTDARALPLQDLLATFATKSTARLRAGTAEDGDGPAADPLLGTVPDAPDPTDAGPPPPGVRVELTEQSRWDSGACFDGNVHNGDDVAQPWSATLRPEGDITSIWNATATPQGDGSVQIAPSEAWNQTIAAHSSAVLFGFCVAF